MSHKLHWIAGIILLLSSLHARGHAAEFKTLHTFAAGSSSLGKPLIVGSTLYGTTFANGDTGELFKINTNGSGYSTLYEFNGTFPASQAGTRPTGPLAYDGAKVYGTTMDAGATGNGAIYAYDLATGVVAPVAPNPFPPGGDLNGAGVVLSGNRLYGVAGIQSSPAYLYGVNQDGTGYSFVQSNLNNLNPRNLVVSGSTIYGALGRGGADSNGAIFAFDANGSNFHLIHEFGADPSDGSLPSYSPLFVDGSTIYGTTMSGGIHGAGTVFRLNTDGTGFELLHEFSNSEGRSIQGVVKIGSKLIGMSTQGGAFNRGTVFMLGVDGSDFELVHEFDVPVSLALGLTASGNTAYGFTPGTIFSVTVPEPTSISLGLFAVVSFVAISRRCRKRSELAAH